MAKGIPFLIKKRDIYYLQKRVPKKLIPTIGREFVRLSLRTKDKATAIRTAGPILAALERDWHYQLFAIPTGTNVLDHFGPNASNEPTLAEAAASYVEMKARAEDRKFTNPTNLVINAIVKQSGNKVISAFVRSDTVRFRDSLIRKGVSSATVKRNLSIIRSIWNSEKEHLLTAASSQRNIYIAPIIEFAIETGMRRSEILNLRWCDVDLENGFASLYDTKNGEDRRVPLTKTAKDVLSRLPTNKERVFPISATCLRLAWNRARKKVGITDLRFHDLRHEAVSRFFEMGMSVPEVALISGHKDVRQLFRYTHLNPENVFKKYAAF